MLSLLARPWLLFALVFAAALLAPQRADADFSHHQRVDRVVVFGDSLSDSGNVFALNGGQTVAPPDYGMGGVDEQGIPEVITLIPAAPYAGGRFSNGATWIELFAGAIGLGSSAKPAVPGALFGLDDGRASNYAVGGATAGDIGVSQFPLATQVQLFLSDVRGQAPAHALYVLEFGGNDIRAAQVAEDPSTVFTAALTAMGQNIATLYAAGARRFLVWNPADLGRTPAIRRLDAAVCQPVLPGCIAGGATQASAFYNQQLRDVLKGLRAVLPGIVIVEFDAFQLLADVQANPAKFGLQDATTACIQPFVPPLFRCARPDRHFFWDGIHPTRAGHAIIAFLVGKTLVTAVLQDD